MNVIFKRMFFGPDGNRYRAERVHSVPDSWAAPVPPSKGKKTTKYRVLPDDVKILAEPAPAPAPEEKVEVDVTVQTAQPGGPQIEKKPGKDGAGLTI